MDHFVMWNVGESHRKINFLPLPAPGAKGAPPILHPEVPEEEHGIVAVGGDANGPNVLTPGTRYVAEQLMDMKAFAVFDIHVPFLSLPDASVKSIAELVETGIG
eukprot:4999745-Pyramimonas_sp.AAC.2